VNRFIKKITIDDVAKLAGVSKATVSSVMNRKPNVSAETSERVMEVIRKLNYQPDRIARSLSVKKTQSIGIVVKQIDNPYFTKIIRGVFSFMSEREYTVLLGSSELSPAKERKSVETLLRQQVDGLILSPLQGPGADLSYLSGWIQDQGPLVLLEKVPNLAVNVVDIQNAKAAVQAVEYLIRLGHRRIAYYAGPGYSMHNQERLSGFQQAMMKYGLPVLEGFVSEAGVYIEDGFRAAHRQFSESGEKPTAIFCFNDLVAIGAMNALSGLGFRVPEDASVIGFDDIEFCESVKVPLSSVRVPAFEMGRAAAELLLKQIEDHGENARETVELDATLVLRDSCAIPKQ
jgi:LacI family transcriptional regulator/LacI family repressor for deo operon, udp, cdd, tsx, nupC, and nupG